MKSAVVTMTFGSDWEMGHIAHLQLRHIQTN